MRPRPSLSGEQEKAVIGALRHWFESHPSPDAPVVAFPGGETLSAREIARAVEMPGSEYRNYILRVFAIGTAEPDPLSLDEILASFTSPDAHRIGKPPAVDIDL